VAISPVRVQAAVFLEKRKGFTKVKEGKNWGKSL